MVRSEHFEALGEVATDEGSTGSSKMSLEFQVSSRSSFRIAGANGVPRIDTEVVSFMEALLVATSMFVGTSEHD